MQLNHVNRRGQRYYIFQGKTKTGKPKYFASRKATSEKGEPADSLPEAFEVFENPANATVTVRRRKSERVLPGERELVERLALELSAYSVVQTISDGDQIVIYTPDRDPVAAASALELLFGPEARELSHSIADNVRYSPEMRFTLMDDDSGSTSKRSWCAERYCYRGSSDGWLPLGTPAPLEQLARTYVRHLGRESFYELI